MFLLKERNNSMGTTIILLGRISVFAAKHFNFGKKIADKQILPYVLSFINVILNRFVILLSIFGKISFSFSANIHIYTYKSITAASKIGGTVPPHIQGSNVLSVIKTMMISKSGFDQPTHNSKGFTFNDYTYFFAPLHMTQNLSCKMKVAIGG